MSKFTRSTITSVLLIGGILGLFFLASEEAKFFFYASEKLPTQIGILVATFGITYTVFDLFGEDWSKSLLLLHKGIVISLLGLSLLHWSGSIALVLYLVGMTFANANTEE